MLKDEKQLPDPKVEKKYNCDEINNYMQKNLRLSGNVGLTIFVIAKSVKCHYCTMKLKNEHMHPPKNIQKINKR